MTHQFHCTGGEARRRRSHEPVSELPAIASLAARRLSREAPRVANARPPTASRTFPLSLAAGIAVIAMHYLGGCHRPIDRRTSLEHDANSTAPSSTVKNTIGMELTLIPPGSFQMGDGAHQAGSPTNQIPRHDVGIGASFYMGTFEVTQGQWKAVMQSRPWHGMSLVAEGDDFPAVYVSWKDADAFCKKLSEIEGRRYRLPTEAEWEYVCRAGKLTAYSFGDIDSPTDHFSSHVWCRETLPPDSQHAQQIGTKLPNPWGICDMHGNVAEWCQDWYSADYYRYSPAQDPTGPESGNERVLRGGSWFGSVAKCTASFRTGYAPSLGYDHIGFRVVQLGEDSTVRGETGNSGLERLGLAFVTIPAGRFLMGVESPPLAVRSSTTGENLARKWRDAMPQHEVEMGEFAISRTEITQSQWELVMGTRPWAAQLGSGPDLPATHVTWEEAVEFCRRLGERNGKSYRLPTEAEWEYACRAGSTTTYGFGDDPRALTRYAWYSESFLEQSPHAVGKKLPNLWGLRDMHGNVEEWCHDFYSRDYYERSPEQNPLGPTTGDYRVVRGGSFISSPTGCASAYRSGHKAKQRSAVCGFRIVRKDHGSD